MVSQVGVTLIGGLFAPPCLPVVSLTGWGSPVTLICISVAGMTPWPACSAVGVVVASLAPAEAGTAQ
jgi:hypothetical protein